MAKKKKYSEMTIQELNVELMEVKSSLFNFRFQKSMQQLEHPQKITHTKKEIARIKTFIRKLELGIS
tara:strand:- start:552 stop:752 length:201 start_codon:yes stop_codon:yes gene_type:complete